MVQSSGESSYVWFGFISISLFFTFSWRVETKEARKSKDDPVPGKVLLVTNLPVALANAYNYKGKHASRSSYECLMLNIISYE